MPSPPLTGLIIDSPTNNYRLIKQIGFGANGYVYEAVDKDGDVVAVKIIYHIHRPDENDMRILSILSRYPQCNEYVSCFYEDFDTAIESNGLAYDCTVIVMEMIVGMSIKEYFSTLQVYPEDTMTIFIECLKGLDFIHSHDVAHHDIHPENIMITKEGYIKYIDFGGSCNPTIPCRDMSLMEAQFHDIMMLGQCMWEVIGLTKVPEYTTTLLSITGTGFERSSLSLLNHDIEVNDNIYMLIFKLIRLMAHCIPTKCTTQSILEFVGQHYTISDR